jgi:hypothetical protein
MATVDIMDSALRANTKPPKPKKIYVYVDDGSPRIGRQQCFTWIQMTR